MSTDSADRNLLFGVLAVQLDFVSRDDLIAATSRWVLDKQQPLSAVFLEQGMLSEEESQLIDGVVQKQLERNNDDPRQSLNSNEVFNSIRATLGDLEDADLRSTVEFDTLPIAASDPHATQVPTEDDSVASQQRFKVLRLHQKGGLGSVSIALDEELNREIALKEILTAHADNYENRTRFIREAEITGALEHPGVVPVYSLGKFADGRPYYAMRFIRGMNLQMAIEDHHKPTAHKPHDDVAAQQVEFRQLLGRFIDVCLAMEYAHSRNVIHRDLKPGNIMLGDYGETLVVDWGLAKTLDDPAETVDSLVMPVHTSKRASSTSTMVGRVVGTPAYMSPEQAAGRLDALGPTSDIYSLGATLYHLITGKVAFSGTEEEVLANVQLGRFDRPREANSSVPRALEAICIKSMARLPSERYESGRELADDLERFLAGERVLAYEEPLTARAWRWIRNHKPLVYSSAAALAVTLTALTISVVTLSAANVRVRASRDEATRSYEEADRQRQRAERNFGLARNAVRDYYISVSEETLLKQPGFQPLRESLLRQALVYYQGFLDERQEDSTLREEVAQAHFFTGQIKQAIESPAEALPHYEQAAQMQQQLLESKDDKHELQAAFGKTLNAQGDASLRLGQLAEAEAFFRQAINVRDRMAQANPDDIESARLLASSAMNLGSVLFYSGQLPQAIDQTKSAQTIRLAHTSAGQTAPPKLRRDLGMGYYVLANIYSAAEDVERAEKNFLLAITTFEQLLADDPTDMNHRRKLAVCQRMLGELMGELGADRQSIEYLRSAQESLAQLRTRNPDVLEFASDLAGVHIRLGQTLGRQNKPDEAAISFDKAIELLRDNIEQAPTVPRYQFDLGNCLRESGKVLAVADRRQAAAAQLKDSQAVLAELVKQAPTNEKYTTALQLTNDELARVTASTASDSPKSNELPNNESPNQKPSNQEPLN